MNKRFRVAVTIALVLSLLPFSVVIAAEQQEQPFVTGIEIEGNDEVAEAVIREAITSTVIGKRVSKEDITSDLKAIGETGYFADVSANVEPYKNGARVIFTVVEYPVVKDIVIETDVLPAGELETFMQTKQGEILNGKQLHEDVQTVVDKAFSEYGIAVHPADLSVSQDGIVTLVLDEIIVEDIRFEGNEKTRDHVIRRELKIESGDVLDIEKINESHRRLLLTGYFDEVSRSFENTDDPTRVILTFHFTERKTGSFTAGVGYSSRDKLFGHVRIAEDNFLGRGERVSLRAEFGQNMTYYDFGFYEPWLDDEGTSLDLNLYRDNRLETTTIDDTPLQFYDRRTGGNIAVGRPIGDYTRASLRLKIENSEVIGKEPGSLGDMEGSSSVRSLTLSTYTDTTNHRFYPTEGFRTRFSAEVAGKFLGGDSNFNRYNAEFSKYVKVGSNDQTVALRAKTGLITGEVPVQERFRIGGADTVRGYQRGEEGLEGEKMLLFNAEYRFKITDSVRGVVFSDAGRAWEHESRMSLSDLKFGYGVGVRLDTPLGIMRLDYGIGEDGGQSYFSLGSTF